MAKKQNNQIIIAAVIIAVVILVGGRQGWFQRLGDTYVEDTTIINQLENGLTGTCTLDITPNVITAGGSVTGKIEDSPNTLCIVYANGGTGWTEVARGLTNSYGEISLTSNVDIPGDYELKGVCGTCTTNSETLIVNPLAEPDTPEVGDDVGTGNSGSGNGNFGDDFITSPITLDWTTGGPYILGVRIIRSWNYKNSECMYAPQQYPMEWTFYDSNGMAWQEYDYVPVNGAYDVVCPVVYHPDAPWKFVVSVGIQDCGVEYSWNLQPYICEEA